MSWTNESLCHPTLVCCSDMTKTNLALFSMRPLICMSLSQSCILLLCGRFNTIQGVIIIASAYHIRCKDWFEQLYDKTTKMMCCTLIQTSQLRLSQTLLEVMAQFTSCIAKRSQKTFMCLAYICVQLSQAAPGSSLPFNTKGSTLNSATSHQPTNHSTIDLLHRG